VHLEVVGERASTAAGGGMPVAPIEEGEAEHVADVVCGNPHPKRPGGALLGGRGDDGGGEDHLRDDDAEFKGEPSGRVEGVGAQVGPGSVLVLVHPPQKDEPARPRHARHRAHRERRDPAAAASVRRGRRRQRRRRPHRGGGAGAEDDRRRGHWQVAVFPAKD
jgi:hypothetical protein